MLFEEKVFKRTIYKGKAVSFCVDKVKLPNNKSVTREYMNHPGAVAVIAVEKSRKLVFVKQYRYPVGEITFEIPAGKLNSNKDNFLKRAKAELLEETGYKAKKFKHLLDFWPTPAFSNEKLRIYIAWELEKGKPSPDEDEFLDVVLIKDSEALKMIKTGKIKDSKTIIAILYYYLLCKRGKL
ncbi:MAG: NUDIX hydrolase [Elusimicrobiales bacterium]|nr:NUDIX hydrolase [Elusimicrobiales bacterium]